MGDDEGEGEGGVDGCEAKTSSDSAESEWCARLGVASVTGLCAQRKG